MALLSRTWSVYPSARGHLKASTIDVGSDTFKAVLLSGSYTPGSLTATQRSDVAAYALGTDQTVSLSNSSGTVSTSASASWSGSLSPRYVAIYSDTHANDALLCVADLGGVNGPGSFTLPAQTLFTFDELTVVSFNAFAHEPTDSGAWAGYARRFNRHFNSIASNGTDDGTGTPPDETGGSEGWDATEWDSMDNGAIITAPGTLPVDDGNGNCLEITYPDGFNAGSGPIAAVMKGLGESRVYVSLSFRIGSDFDGYGTPNKFFWIRGSWGNGPFISLDGSGAANLEVDLNMQGTADSGDGYIGNANEVSNAARTIERDKWYVMEIIAIQGEGDGECHIYVGCPEDGDTEPVLAISATGLNYGAGTFGGGGWNFQINPTYGGTSATHSGIGHWYVGHCHVGGA